MSQKDIHNEGYFIKIEIKCSVHIYYACYFVFFYFLFNKKKMFTHTRSSILNLDLIWRYECMCLWKKNFH